MNALPLVAVGSFGGTIAMAHNDHGLTPDVAADTLVAAVPALASIVRTTTHEVCNVGSPSVRLEDVVSGLAWAQGQVDAGATAVVFTHGTDTIEETAFLLDLLWDREAPLVLTGAMRSPDEPGADGPANLLSAVLTACAPSARGLGVLVVMNDQVYRADRIRKAHTFAVDAFRDPWNPPIGRVTEGRLEVEFLSAAGRHAPLPLGEARATVSIIGTGIGDDGRAFAAVVAAGSGALVVDGVGAGHVSAPAADVLEELVHQVPVVMASRTRGGRTGETTYAYPGGDVDLINRGIIMAGRLNATQARLLAWVLLSTQADRAEWRHQFALRGGTSWNGNREESARAHR